MSESTAMPGRVAVVTGAGQGIGQAEALALAALGAQIVVNDVDPELAAGVVERIRRTGGSAVPAVYSVATPDGGAAIIETALSAFGTVDAVINNAGFLRPAPFEELTADQIRAIVDVHLLGAFHVTQPAWPVMKAKGYGRVVLTGSSAGLFGQGANANYCAAKGGVYGLARALAVEGADFGILVNTVLPFASTQISVRNPVPGVAEQRARFGGTYSGAIAARRDPATVAPLVALLAGPACPGTGATYSACGGRYARVVVGLGEGWYAPDPASLSAEELLGHWGAVSGGQNLHEPAHLFDEVRRVIDGLDACEAFATESAHPTTK